jgi:geranylgeranylglycerol-phosphate geranylgeranyltransferase
MRGSPIDYLRLFRPDAAAIAFFGYLVGVSLATTPRWLDALIAFAVSAASMNFIYSFNAWADSDIDKINKPDRPIPSGRLSPRAALVYCLGLLVISVVFPLLIFRDVVTLGLFWSLPVLGLAYSQPPVRLKTSPVPAAAATSAILVAPMLAGYAMHTGDWVALPFFGALFVFCLGVIPLKDIEDLEGDVAGGSGNWFSRLGKNKLLGYSCTVLSIDIAAVVFAPIPLDQRIYLWTFAGGALVTIVAFWVFNLTLPKLYKTIIRVVILSGVALFLTQLFGLR